MTDIYSMVTSLQPVFALHVYTLYATMMAGEYNDYPSPQRC
jgi:hypothetical protein